MDIRLPEASSADRSSANPQLQGSRPSVPVVGPIDVRSTALALLSVLAIIFTLRWAEGVLLPLVFSVLLAYALDPVVGTLERLWLPRWLGAALLLLAILVVSIYGSFPLRAQAIVMLDKIPAAVQQMRLTMRLSRYQAEEGVIEKVQEAAEEIQKAAEEAGGSQPLAPPGVTRVRIEQPGLNLSGYVWWGSQEVLAVVGQMATVVILVYFFLASGDLYKRKLVRITGPTLTNKKITVQILDDFNHQIRRYLFVLLLSCIFVGVLTWLAFVWIGLEQAPLWGVIAGIGTVVPYLGPALVFAATALAGLLQFETVTMALAVGAISLVIAGIQGWFLTPWLTSRASSINTVAVFVSLLFWGWLWGAMGLVVAAPIMIIVKVCCDHIENLRPIGELLGK